jgi:hypothetical protein
VAAKVSLGCGKLPDIELDNFAQGAIDALTGNAAFFDAAGHPAMRSVPGADRGPRAGSPRGVVDATGSQTQLEWRHPPRYRSGFVPFSRPFQRTRRSRQ